MPESSAGKDAGSSFVDAAADVESVRGHAAFARFLFAMECSQTLAIYGLDRSGRILCWNQACSRLYGIPAQQAMGAHVCDVVGREDQAGFQSTLDAAWGGNLAPPRDWRVRVGENRLWVYTVIVPMLDPAGGSSLVCMDVDIGRSHRAEPALLKMGNEFQQFFERSSEAIVMMRGERLLQFNPAALKLFGYCDAAEVPGSYLEDFSPPLQANGQSSREKSSAMFAIARAQGSHRFEWLYRKSDGSQFRAEVLVTCVSGDGEADCLMYSVIHDVTERKHAEHALALAAQAYEHSREAVLIVDAEHRVISVNPAFVRITGFPMHAVLGKPASVFAPEAQDFALQLAMNEALQARGYWEGELWGRRHDGQTYPQWTSITAVQGNAALGHYIVKFADITHKKADEEQARRLAEYDFLTSLPNRFLLRDRFGQAVAAAHRNHTRIALLFLDLDRFKNVNDTLGHHIGDKLLQEVAARLKKCVRAIDTVSRQGGDEFVLLLADIMDAGHAAHVAENVMQQLNKPIGIDGHVCSVTASVGVSLYPDDGDNLETLLEHADVAMYHAKDAGRDGYEFFNRDMSHRNHERLELEHCLRDALGRDEFYLEYLPEVDIVSGRITAAEALIRWRHPQFGNLSPARYIAVAEECGLGEAIGRWVLNAACRQARAWIDAGTPMVVSVNLSPAQFKQKNLARTVRESLRQADLDPAWLELEIVEHIMLGAADSALAELAELSQLGVRLAVDDFGTGYSSLSSLTRFPIDKIKIDQSCLQDLLSKQESPIVSTIIAMARCLNLKVIAEGVETEEQLRRLQELGCDQYQGYYLSHAVAPTEMAQLRHRH